MKNIGLVLFIRTQASVQPCLDLMKILSNIADRYYIILVYNENLDIPNINDPLVFNHKIGYKANLSSFSMPLNYIVSQLKVSYSLLNCSYNINTWTFFMGETSVMPILLLKLLKKKSVLCLSGSLENDLKLRRPSLSRFILSCGKSGLKFSDYIVVYSKNLIAEWNLNTYIDKILIAPRHFINFSQFSMEKKLKDRNNCVGYVGRLSPEKGALNFIESILLLNDCCFEFSVIGDGVLRTNIEQFIHQYNLSDRLKLVGWVPHKSLSTYLNNMKLLVLPSYTEGLPNIILEAMACGTPVLTTSVGAINSLITDEKTGFIMENNSPECIAKNIIRALEHPDLDKIAEDARHFVEFEFNYGEAVKRYDKVYQRILLKHTDNIDPS